MPFSTNYFKKETINYIQNNFKKNIKILDVGAGAGTYSDYLKPLGFENIDCVEVFEDYINNYNLSSKYSKVILGNIIDVDVNFNEYDLIILGDVLEHISELNAIQFISKIENIPTIIAVPFESPQGEHFNNKYEIHLQDDLTLENFVSRFKNFHPICLRFDYGVFINQIPKNIYFEVGQYQLPNNFLKFVVNNYPNSEYVYLNNTQPKEDDDDSIKKSQVTIVTALWDLGRGKIGESFKRGYDNYLEKFSELLKTDVSMYIFCDPSDEEFIWKFRKKSNTVINKMSLNELLEWFNFTEQTNKIRTKEEWLSQAGWLKDSPQATLEGYNPLVMSKMFMLNNVTIWNPFQSEYFFWIDAGITNTVHYGYFTHDKVFNLLPSFIDENNDFMFLTYPYDGGYEIHGFERESIARYSNTDYVKFVCRGGFFGGKKERINQLNGIYYAYLENTLKEGFMGTEESIFTIMMYNYPELITQFMIEDNGLVWVFFEDLKEGRPQNRVVKTQNSKKTPTNKQKVGLYVITFNSPNQFEVLITSMLEYDKDFISKPKKYLLDNSTDLSTTPKYKELCDRYGFEHIKKDNLGIVGGRVWVAEHFESTDLDYYYWFEDDMAFYPKKGEVCKNGFVRYIDNLYDKVLQIMNEENFDFLKLNFTEFFGDNSVQWSWYNVPQEFREKQWPNNRKLPKMGLDPNSPKTDFKNIKIHRGLPYVTGEIYLCNWPIILSREGNYKCYLETKWAHPYEQTLMSYCYQEMIKGRITAGLLLATPTEHNRFEFYESNLRKES